MDERLDLVAGLRALRDLATDEEDVVVVVDREEGSRRTEPPDRHRGVAPEEVFERHRSAPREREGGHRDADDPEDRHQPGRHQLLHLLSHAVHQPPHLLHRPHRIVLRQLLERPW